MSWSNDLYKHCLHVKVLRSWTQINITLHNVFPPPFPFLPYLSPFSPSLPSSSPLPPQHRRRHTLIWRWELLLHGRDISRAPRDIRHHILSFSRRPTFFIQQRYVHKQLNLRSAKGMLLNISAYVLWPWTPQVLFFSMIWRMGSSPGLLRLPTKHTHTSLTSSTEVYTVDV